VVQVLAAVLIHDVLHPRVVALPVQAAEANDYVDQVRFVRVRVRGEGWRPHFVLAASAHLNGEVQCCCGNVRGLEIVHVIVEQRQLDEEARQRLLGLVKSRERGEALREFVAGGRAHVELEDLHQQHLLQLDQGLALEAEAGDRDERVDRGVLLMGGDGWCCSGEEGEVSEGSEGSEGKKGERLKFCL
jgi:hypothetical protein